MPTRGVPASTHGGNGRRAAGNRGVVVQKTGPRLAIVTAGLFLAFGLSRGCPAKPPAGQPRAPRFPLCPPAGSIGEDTPLHTPPEESHPRRPALAPSLPFRIRAPRAAFFLNGGAPAWPRRPSGVVLWAGPRPRLPAGLLSPPGPSAFFGCLFGSFWVPALVCCCFCLSLCVLVPRFSPLLSVSPYFALVDTPPVV